MKVIEIDEALNLDCVFIDTRTPKEYNEATIPNAINVPLFSNEERVVVGTIYTKVGKNEAIEKGMEFVSKQLPIILKEFNNYKDRKIVVFCWRGGMRSKSITSLLDSLGFDVYQLKGGHKAFRRYVLDRLSNYSFNFKLIVLHGLTGSGKTEILKRFSNSIDLEDLAQHRNSMLGGVGLKPRGQKMFDALLLKKLDELKNEKYVLIEGESRRLGDLNLPNLLYNQMKNGINVLIESPIDDRVKRIVKEYGLHRDEIKQILPRFKRLMSGNNFSLVNEFICNDELEEAALILLNEHYDHKYGYSINKIKYELRIKDNYLNNLKKFIASLP